MRTREDRVSDAAKIARLRCLQHKLSSRDVDFAKSLLSAKRPTPKQIFWMERLADRAEAPPPKATGGMNRIVEMMRNAAQHRRSVKIVFAAGDGLLVRLAAHNGGYAVTSNGSFNNRVFYGRIEDNAFTPHIDVNPDVAARITAALLRICNDPEAAARDFGKLYGYCCFCDRELTDARSLNVGYGPVCAKNFALKWGVNSDEQPKKGETDECA